MTPADLSTVIDTIDRQLPGWEHTEPASITSHVDHVWHHPTEAERIVLTHWLTGTRFYVSIAHRLGPESNEMEKGFQVLDCVEQVPMWLCQTGATAGTLTLAGAR